MTTTFEYVPFADNAEHVERHFGGSLTIGSKFYPHHDNPEVKDLVRSVDGTVRGALENQSTEDGKPQREVIELITSNPVGTDALIETTGQDFIEVIRDAGTPGQTAVKTVLSDAIPETNQVSIIAGPYGPTGKAGIYTMFPGDPGEPFPNPERQSPEQCAQYQEYWSKRGFLATAQELEHAVQDMKRLLAGELTQDEVPVHNQMSDDQLSHMIQAAETKLGYEVTLPNANRTISLTTDLDDGPGGMS